MSSSENQLHTDLETKEENLKPTQLRLLTFLKECLESCFTVSSSKSYAKISCSQFVETIQEMMDTDLSTTSWHTLLKTEHNDSLKGSKKRLLQEQDNAGESFTIQKKNKVTFTSSTDASITDPIVGVQDSEQSKSNADDLASLLALTTPKVYNSGLTGSNIFFKRQGTCYTWKSPAWTTATRYIDLKLYNEPNSLQEMKPMDQWKAASLRAKVLIGTPHSDVNRTLKINNLLDQLIPLLIGEVNSQPNCESTQRD